MPTTLDTVATILFTYAGHSVVACVIALALARVIRDPHDRDFIWKAALVAPLLTTALAAPTLATGAQLDVSSLVRSVAGPWLPSRVMMVSVVRDASGESVVRQVSDPVTLTIAVVVVGVALVTVIAAAVRMMARYRRRGVLLSDRQPYTTHEGITISLAEGLPSPVALGDGEVCLPNHVVREFSEEERSALIAHERAHLERRDPSWLAATEMIGVLSAFQPMVWPVIRAFRRDVELICDESAVRRTQNPHALISALARLASPFDARSPLLGAALAHDGSPLVERAERIADLSHSPGMDRSPLPALALAVSLALALLAVPTIASSPRDATLPIDPIAIDTSPHLKVRYIEVQDVSRRVRAHVVMRRMQ